MNVFDRAGHKWRKNRKRGVSPIIATILLVAITVVLAAVLYVLISGLTHTGASTPYTLGMSSPTASSTGTGATAVYYYAITISPQSGLTTSMFGLSLQTPTGGSAGATGTAPAACKFTAGGTAYAPATCTGGTGGWYAVLYWQGNGSIANVFSGTTPSWSSPTLPVTNSESLVLITVTGSTGFTGSSDTLNAYATGSSSVSGQSGAF